MITYVNNRLNQWARWIATGRKVRGLGYPSCISWARTPGSGNGSPEFDEDAYSTDQAVRALPAELKHLVEQFYTRIETVDSLSRTLGCSRDTVYSRLHQAHQHMLGSLNDIAAGCFRPALDRSDRTVQHASNCG